jgi:glucose uptake protein
LAIPTNSFTAELLLIFSFLFLGLWSSTFKAAGNRWRFELYSFDFAIGVLLFAAAAAYMLGTFGTEIGFADHFMISSRTNQFIVFAAGCLFAFGNMLLLSAIALLGLSFAYAMVTAAALLSLVALQFNGPRAIYLSATVVAALLTLIFQAKAASRGEKTLPGVSLPVIVRKSSTGRTIKPAREDVGLPNSTKGTTVSILSGLSLGLLVSPFEKAIFDEFGLGPLAGLLLFSAGILASTLFLNFYFMNISVHGGSISLKYYVRGSLGQHSLGILGGAICGAGILLLLIVAGFPADDQPSKFWFIILPLGAGLLAVGVGLSKWREQTKAPGSVMRSVLIGAFFLAVAIGLFAVAMEKVAPPPPASELVHPQSLA